MTMAKWQRVVLFIFGIAMMVSGIIKIVNALFLILVQKKRIPSEACSVAAPGCSGVVRLSPRIKFFTETALNGRDIVTVFCRNQQPLESPQPSDAPWQFRPRA